MTDLRLSNSETKEFRRCKRKWYWHTYRQLSPATEDAPGSNLSIGNIVHDALAEFYGPDKADPVAWAEADYARQLSESPAEEVEIGKEKALVIAMLTGYVEWLAETGADQDLIITGTEQMVEIPLVEGVTLLSKLDAPVERISDGAKLALEHKTVQGLDIMLPLLKLDTQLLTEHLVRFLHAKNEGATAEEAYDQCHGVLYNMLKKVKRTSTAKPPFYGREDVPHNINELRNHWHHVVSIAAEITAARTRLDAGESNHSVCQPNPTRDCTWDCPFFKVCVMQDDGSDVEGALAAMFVERDPLERYADATAL